MLAVVLVYLGLGASALAIVCLVKPLPFIGMATRRNAAYTLGVSVVLVAAGFLFPTSETAIASPLTQLDHFVPVYQFNEIHSVRVMASRAQVYKAIKAVTPDEILLFKALTWIRRLGRPTPQGVLNAPGGRPILETATKSSFLVLADERDREIVIATPVVAPVDFKPKREPEPDDFRNVRATGFAIAAMNFLIESDGSTASIVTTETRVYATDAQTRTRFAAYWRVIYPGSALIRVMWLRAIKIRAEAEAVL